MALTINRQASDIKGEWSGLYNMGQFTLSGQYQKALEYYEKSLAIRQKLGDVDGEE